MFRLTSLVVLSLALCVSGAAKDAIQASVTPIGTPVPIVVENGNRYSSGTYAIGTIQLFYTVNAFQFPAGPFAQFQLAMQDAHIGSSGQDPTYPVTLNLRQTGSANLVLTPVSDTFSVSGTGWTGSSTVTISIPASVASNPELNEDGDELVGNLQLVTSPPGSKLDTVTTVQVHILLVHPTDCFRMFDFITDEGHTTRVDSTQVNVNVKKDQINSTNPFGQFSNNVLLVNACAAPKVFDLQVLLDGSFRTNPHDNAGQAVFTYVTPGAITPDTFSIGVFGTGTPKGQQLCLGSITVPAGQTFLAAVHTGINKDLPASTLNSAGGTFHFSSTMYAPGSGCTGALLTVTPNPAEATLDYTLK